MTRKLRFRGVEQQSDSSLRTTELRFELSCTLSCPSLLQGARFLPAAPLLEDMDVTKYSGLLFGSLSPLTAHLLLVLPETLYFLMSCL